MGTAHARQQALVSQSRGASSLGSSDGRFHGVQNVAGGSSGNFYPDASSSTAPIPGEEGQEDKVPVVFTWTHGGQNVSLAASFSGWRHQIPMVRSGNEFVVVQELPRGVHQYKFIVDDHWRFSPDQPKTQDDQGNMNNVLDISAFQRYQIGGDDHEAQPVFSQNIPDVNDYTTDAPTIPIVLSKSHYCAMPPRPQVAGGKGGAALCIPTHALCDHVYLQESFDNATASIAVTHRYGRKYSTTVYATNRLTTPPPRLQ
eukprot:TRINITY_DN2691_c0_g1_i1.p1 TRINITY_DN2691_c0_g1~~TRINITY_DN2691_c0_g1_i1.p1  ORF type:complete len:257 (+),score=34.25 TRINITY_DN2691_c0_g1_i1:95-865(+)